jgi:hypothetical protein
MRSGAVYHSDRVPLFARMTYPPPGDGGAPTAPPLGAAPFAVTAPPELTLTADRSGTTSFTITNLTGRPVRARLVPRGQAGAQDAWLSIVGVAEVPMAVAATITATVQVKVPAEVPVGQHTLFLEVVAEDDTESVAGQSVSFSVPPAPPVKKRFPWWIVVVAAVALLLIVGGAVFFVSRDKGGGGDTHPGGGPPKNTEPPRVAGVVRIGQQLTAQDGVWDPPDVTIARQWQRCSAAGDSCLDIPGAGQTSYAVSTDDTGKTIRIVVSATNGAGSTHTESATVGPVQPDLVPVPPLVKLSVGKAEQAAAAAGLKVQASVFGRSCPPLVITSQDPPAGTKRPRGSVVTVFIPLPLPNFVCGRS